MVLVSQNAQFLLHLVLSNLTRKRKKIYNKVETLVLNAGWGCRRWLGVYDYRDHARVKSFVNKG